MDYDEDSFGRLWIKPNNTFNYNKMSKVRPMDDNNNIMRWELGKLQKRRNFLTSITIDSSFLLSVDLWPKVKNFQPKQMSFESLRELHIQIPSIDVIQDMRKCKDKFYEFLGMSDVETCLEKEERMKRNVYFILEVILAVRLFCFSFKNGRYGSNLTHSTGFIFWDAPLKNFMSRHAKSLKRVYIDTTGSPIESISMNALDYYKFKHMAYVFPALEEISLHLWNWNNVDRSLFNNCNYWISLLNEQTINHLRKVEWYSCESLSWNYMISPIIQENEKSLQEINVLGFGYPIEAVASDSKIFSTGFAIDCTQFKHLSLLTVIKLQMFRSVLTNLERLPVSLREIEIHCVRIKTIDLVHLCNLPKLNKLTLFNLAITNTSWGYPAPNGYARSSLPHEYGVTRDILKMLLGIRSLNILHICGFIRSPSPVPECATLHGISWRKRLSSSTLVNGFSKKSVKDDDKELNTLLSILRPVAKDCDRSLLRITEE